MNSVFTHIASYFGLRQHQIDAFNSISKSPRGVIISPAGTGKTTTFGAVIVDELYPICDTSQVSKVVIVLSHRILLNAQHIKRLCSALHDFNVQFNVIKNDSSNDNRLIDINDRPFKIDEHQLISTTETKRIKDAIKYNKNNSKHTIIFSTYQSLDKLLSIEADLVIGDEAHNIEGNPKVGSNKESILKHFKVASQNWLRYYLFTATPRIGKRSTGGTQIGLVTEEIDDDDIPETYIDTIGTFGKVIYEFTPKEAIGRGEILSPRLHIIERIGSGSSIGVKNNTEMMAISIGSAFTKHNEIVGKHSEYALSAKILVACTGITNLKDLVTSPDMIKYCEDNNVISCGISSGYCIWNNVEVDRTTFMNNLYKLDLPENDKTKVIMFHVRILTEGIDLPSLTGVALFNDKTMTSLIQLIGRAARLFKQDRKNLYNGSIELSDIRKKFSKKYAWVIIPDFVKTVSIPFVESIIEKIYMTYQPERDFLVVYETGDTTEEITGESLLSNDDEKDPTSVKFLIKQRIKNSLFYSLCELEDEVDDWYAEY